MLALCAIFKEGWEKSKGFKATWWGGFGIYFLTAMALVIISVGIQFIFENSMSTESADLIKNIGNVIRWLLLYPLVIGLAMLGIKRAINQPVKSRDLLHYYRFIVRIDGVMIALGFIVATLALIGTICFTSTYILLKIVGGICFLACIYLLCSYSFAPILTADKKLGIWRSLETSRKAITPHWFKLFFILIILLIVLIISAIPLGIGLIWALPWKSCVWGVAYRTFFSEIDNSAKL